jgi:hypothetical protein
MLSDEMEFVIQGAGDYYFGRDFRLRPSFIPAGVAGQGG